MAKTAAGFFLFTTREGLLAGDPLTHEWVNAKGRAVRLAE